ncbi:MAG: nucleotidyl transferase AbiEii/AbiGii toxin family protein [Candidatus Micrarchaeia archaeon]
MLDADELLKTGVYKQPYQQEKDYIEEIFLERLFRCCNSLVFKGGTALSKFYGSQRFSDDLDFAPKAQNEEEAVESKIDKMLDKLHTEVPAKLLRKINTNKVLKYELSIRGPLFITSRKYQHLKIEIGKKESVMESANIVRRNPVYRDIHPYLALIMSESEILAEKVVALLYRRNIKARDLYDIYFMASKGVELKLGLVDAKMKEWGHVFTKEQFSKRVEEIGKMWDKELLRLLQKDAFVSYTKAKNAVVKYFEDAGLI